MSRIFTNEEEAMRNGMSRAQFQEQQKAIDRSPQSQPKELKAALTRLDEAHAELAAAEADAAAKTGLVAQWDSLLDSRDRINRRLGQCTAILEGYKKGTPHLTDWLQHNLGNVHVAPTLINEALTGLAINKIAEPICTGIISQLEEDLAAAQAEIVSFATEHGLKHLLPKCLLK